MCFVDGLTYGWRFIRAVGAVELPVTQPALRNTAADRQHTDIPPRHTLKQGGEMKNETAWRRCYNMFVMFVLSMEVLRKC